jgi:hypothetical protein
MDAFPYNTGADADKSRLKIIRTVTAPSQSSGAPANAMDSR